MQGKSNFSILSRADLSTVQTGFVENYELTTDIEMGAASTISILDEIEGDIGDLILIDGEELLIISERLEDKRSAKLKPFFEILNHNCYLYHSTGNTFATAFNATYSNIEPIDWLLLSGDFALLPPPEGRLTIGQVWSTNLLDQCLRYCLKAGKKMVFTIGTEKTVTLSLETADPSVNLFEADFNFLSVDESKEGQFGNHVTVVGVWDYESSGTKYQKWAVVVGYISSAGVITTVYDSAKNYPEVSNVQFPVVSSYEEVSINYDEYRAGKTESEALNDIVDYLETVAYDRLYTRYNHEIVLSSAFQRSLNLWQRVVLYTKSGETISSIITKIEKKSGSDVTTYTLGQKRTTSSKHAINKNRLHNKTFYNRKATISVNAY